MFEDTTYRLEIVSEADAEGLLTTPLGSGDALRVALHYYEVDHQIRTRLTAAVYLYLTKSNIFGLVGNTEENTHLAMLVAWSGNITSVQRKAAIAPSSFALHQNYPNPFNPATTIRYNIAVGGTVTLTIFDLKGRKVRTLVNEMQPAGSYLVNWNGVGVDGTPVASGVYLYRLETGTTALTRRLVLLK
ncbi:MAG: T9SS type A sorting domain-containing protein [bacterium]